MQSSVNPWIYETKSMGSLSAVEPFELPDEQMCALSVKFCSDVYSVIAPLPQIFPAQNRARVDQCAKLWPYIYYKSNSSCVPS
jgi:hypothetical protein